MKTKVKMVNRIIFCLFIFILFLFKAQFVQAVSPEDLYVEMSPEGKITRGTAFTPDKTVIRPAYTKKAEDLLKDIVTSDGTPYFKSLDTNVGFTKGLVLYYNNVGVYNNRPLSMKFTYITGPASENWRFQLTLSSSGSIKLYSDMKNISSVQGWVAYQLVYSDTKEAVKNTYVEFPQIISNPIGSKDAGDYTYNTFSMTGLKKIYLQKPRTSLLEGQVSQFESASDGPFLSLRLLSTEYIDQRYIIMSESEYPLIIGGYQSLNYAVTMTSFLSDIESPTVPDYNAPSIDGDKVKDSFQANYSISQAVTATYEQYYPDELDVVLEDKEKLFSTFDATNLKIFKSDGIDITSKIIISKNSDGKLNLAIPKTLLKELRSNTIRISASFKSIDNKKAATFYDSKSGSVKLPLTVNNVRKYGVEPVSSASNIGYAEIVTGITATAVPQKVSVNSTTKDLDLEKVLTKMKSTFPEDSIKIVGFTTDKVFDTVKKDSVDVKVQSTLLPEMTSIVTVPVDVTDDIVTSAFFENQSWIINTINNQLKPKQINKDVYVSDLTKITQVNTDMDGVFTDQLIPKNIRYLVNLTLLSLKNKKMTGTLPEELGDLSRLKDLRVYGNTFNFGIPDSLSNLKDLEYLDLSQNKLSGEIPQGLASLTKLNTLVLNGNNFVGQLPKFKDGFTYLDFSNNQITVNSAELPSFITSATTKNYANSFIKGTEELKLTGHATLAIKDTDITTIKPFDETNQGYFSLQATGKVGSAISLYDTHQFTIINEESKAVLYEGPADKAISIPYVKGMKYKVILDRAELNPNNQLVVVTKVPELKLEGVPDDMSFAISLGQDLTKPVKLTGKLSVFDNRDNGHWRLSFTASALTSGLKTLQGEYTYKDKKGIENTIVTGQKVVIESGASDADKEIIPISDSWNKEQGLQYKMNGSNYIGTYSGNVIWTLEDVPSSN